MKILKNSLVTLLITVYALFAMSCKDAPDYNLKMGTYVTADDATIVLNGNKSFTMKIIDNSETTDYAGTFEIGIIANNDLFLRFDLIGKNPEQKRALLIFLGYPSVDVDGLDILNFFGVIGNTSQFKLDNSIFNLQTTTTP